MYKYEFIVLYKFIQFLLWHDIALCFTDTNSRLHHGLDNQIEPFPKKESIENKARIMFLPADSYEKHRPVGIELIKLEPKKIESQAEVLKRIEDRAYLAGKVETQKTLPLFKVKLETKNFKIPAISKPLTTSTAKADNCDKEKNPSTTTTLKPIYKAWVSDTIHKVFSGKVPNFIEIGETTKAIDILLNVTSFQEPTTESDMFYKAWLSNLLSDKIPNSLESGETTKAKDVPLKGTSFQKLLTQDDFSTAKRVIKSTTSSSKFMFFNEYLKAKKSETPSIDVQGMNNILFIGNKAAINRTFKDQALESRKKHIAKKLVRRINRTKLFTSVNKTRIVPKAKRIKILKNAKKDKAFRSRNQKQPVNRSQLNPSLSDFVALHPHMLSKQLKCIESKMISQMRMTQEIIGRTAGYNDIVLWKLKERGDFRRDDKKPGCTTKVADADKFVDDEPDKKIIFIAHGLSVMGLSRYSCLRYINDFETLLSYYADNLDAFDIYLLPMANPDGVLKVSEFYMWNKNLSPQSACPGVNVDRNFDVAWNESLNVSSCSQLYPGPVPFSEAESSAVKSVLHKYGHKIIGYFHVHLGQYNSDTMKGEAVLFPKGYTAEQGDDDRYLELRGEIEEAMKNMSFTALSVTVDTLHSWYGKISGSSVDYASAVYGVPYTLELIMQLYESDNLIEAALTEVWQNVFDVIFDHIARSQKNKDGYDSIKEYDNEADKERDGNDEKKKKVGDDGKNKGISTSDDENDAGDNKKKEGADDTKLSDEDSKDSESDKRDKNSDKNGKNCDNNDFTLRKRKASVKKDKEKDPFKDSDESF